MFDSSKLLKEKLEFDLVNQLKWINKEFWVAELKDTLFDLV